jgi:hypothetical protein
MNKFILASRIGISVRELEDTMTAEEFAHWQAFFKLIKAHN